MTIYFSFAISDRMFGNKSIALTRHPLDIGRVKYLLLRDKTVMGINPSHKATIKAMKERFGLDLPIPDSPPMISLDHGDSLIVATVNGLPRLTDRHEYTDDEINKATFTFAQWTIIRGV